MKDPREVQEHDPVIWSGKLMTVVSVQRYITFTDGEKYLLKRPRLTVKYKNTGNRPNNEPLYIDADWSWSAAHRPPAGTEDLAFKNRVAA